MTKPADHRHPVDIAVVRDGRDVDSGCHRPTERYFGFDDRDQSIGHCIESLDQLFWRKLFDRSEMCIAVWTAGRVVSIKKPGRSLRCPAVGHSHERLQLEELRVFIGRVRSATGIKLIEGVITSELSRPVDLLVGEFTASRLVISRATHFVDDLYFRPDSGS